MNHLFHRLFRSLSQGLISIHKKELLQLWTSVYIQASSAWNAGGAVISSATGNVLLQTISASAKLSAF